MNRLRAMLAEFGLVIPVGRAALQRHIPALLEDADNSLPSIARALVADAYEHLLLLNQRLKETDQSFAMIADASPSAKRLNAIRGIGPQTSTAIVAAIGNGSQFDCGRDFAAWLGLVPKQYSTGGKTRLGRITKKGDRYIRTLLVHGARAVITNLGDKQDRLSCWCRSLLERRGMNRTIVALAAKNARIIWTMLHHKTDYEIAA